MFTDEEIIEMQIKLEQKYDFFRRLVARTGSERNKNNQLRKNLENCDKRNNFKYEIIKTKLECSNEKLSEMESVIRNVIDDFLENDF